MLVSEATIHCASTPTRPRPRWRAQDHHQAATTTQPSTTTIRNSTRWHFPSQCWYNVTKRFISPFWSFINWKLTTSICSYRTWLTMVTPAMILLVTELITMTPTTTSSGRRRTASSRSSTGTCSFMWVVFLAKQSGSMKICCEESHYYKRREVSNNHQK